MKLSVLFTLCLYELKVWEIKFAVHWMVWGLSYLNNSLPFKFTNNVHFSILNKLWVGNCHVYCGLSLFVPFVIHIPRIPHILFLSTRSSQTQKDILKKWSDKIMWNINKRLFNLFNNVHRLNRSFYSRWVENWNALYLLNNKVHLSVALAIEATDVENWFPSVRLARSALFVFHKTLPSFTRVWGIY